MKFFYLYTKKRTRESLMNKRILPLIVLLLLITLTSGYQTITVQEYHSGNLRRVTGENLVVYVDNNELVYMDNYNEIKRIIPSQYEHTIIATYTGTNLFNDFNFTSQTITKDETIHITTMNNNDRKHRITFDEPLTHTTLVETYMRSTNAGDTKTLHFTNNDGTVIYGTMTITDTKEDRNATLTGTNGVTEIYLHDGTPNTNWAVRTDYIGFQRMIPLDSICSPTDALNRGVFGNPFTNEEKDLFYYCFEEGHKYLYHYKYDEGTLEIIPLNVGIIQYGVQGEPYIRQPTTTSYYLTSNPVVIGVLQDSIYMSVVREGSNYPSVRLIINRTNNERAFGIIPSGDCIVGAYHPQKTEGRIYNTQPFYNDENTMTYGVTNRFSATQNLLLKYCYINPHDLIPKDYNRLDYDEELHGEETREYKARNINENGIEFTHLGFINEDTMKAKCQDYGDVLYCHNTKEYDGFTNNNALFFKNNGYSQATTNNALLPTGETEEFRSMMRYGNLQLLIFNNLQGMIYNPSSILLQKGAFTVRDSGLHTHSLLSGSLYYIDNNDRLLLLRGLPTGEEPPTLVTYADYRNPKYDEDLQSEEYVLKQKQTSYVNTTKTLPFDDEEAYETVTNDYYTYLSISDVSSVRTEKGVVPILIKAIDTTETPLNLAIDCDSRGKTFNIFARSTWEDYSDEAYNPPLTEWIKKGMYTQSVTAFFMNEPRTQPYIFGDTSVAIGNLDEHIGSNGYTQISFLQDYLFEDRTSLNVQLYNIQGREFINYTMRNSETMEYVNYFEVEIGGETVFYEDRTQEVYKYLNTQITVKLILKGNILHYDFMNKGLSFVTGEVVINSPNMPPLSMIRYNFLGTVNSYNDLTNVGIGMYAITPSSIFPLWNYGITQRETDSPYKIYEAVCDYTNKPDNLYYVRIYANKKDSMDYSYFVERVIQVDDNYIEFLEQEQRFEDEFSMTQEDFEAQARQRQTETNIFFCKALSICDAQQRLFFAIVLILLSTITGAILMYQRYENTLSSRLVPVAIYSLLFVYFSSIGWLPTWYIILNIIIIMGALSLFFNPVSRVGGGM